VTISKLEYGVNDGERWSRSYDYEVKLCINVLRNKVGKMRIRWKYILKPFEIITNRSNKMHGWNYIYQMKPLLSEWLRKKTLTSIMILVGSIGKFFRLHISTMKPSRSWMNMWSTYNPPSSMIHFTYLMLIYWSFLSIA